MIGEKMFDKTCACCGSDLPGEMEYDEICPVCGWEEDSVQNDEPDYRGGANTISLNEAKENYQKRGRAFPKNER